MVADAAAKGITRRDPVPFQEEGDLLLELLGAFRLDHDPARLERVDPPAVQPGLLRVPQLRPRGAAQEELQPVVADLYEAVAVVHPGIAPGVAEEDLQRARANRPVAVGKDAVVREPVRDGQEPHPLVIGDPEPMGGGHAAHGVHIEAVGLPLLHRKGVAQILQGEGHRPRGLGGQVVHPHRGVPVVMLDGLHRRDQGVGVVGAGGIHAERELALGKPHAFLGLIVATGRGQDESRGCCDAAGADPGRQMIRMHGLLLQARPRGAARGTRSRRRRGKVLSIPHFPLKDGPCPPITVAWTDSSR